MGTLCPSCAQRLAGAFHVFDHLSRSCMDMLVHLCTVDCSAACNEAAWKLRSMKRLLFIQICREVSFTVGVGRVKERGDVYRHFLMFLRGSALEHENQAALRWCYRHFRSCPAEWELKRWAWRCVSPGRIRCLLYIRAWARADGVVSPPWQAVTDHVAACRLQKQWRISLYDPAFEVCRRKLLAEFEHLGDPRPGVHGSSI